MYGARSSSVSVAGDAFDTGTLRNMNLLSKRFLGIKFVYVTSTKLKGRDVAKSFSRKVLTRGAAVSNHGLVSEVRLEQVKEATLGCFLKRCGMHSRVSEGGHASRIKWRVSVCLSVCYTARISTTTQLCLTGPLETHERLLN